MLELNIRDVEEITIIDIKGELDLQHANDLRAEIKELINKGRLNILINLDETNYMDSSGIGVLVSSLTTLQKKKGILKIVNVKEAVKKVFEFSRLDLVFKIFNSEEEALSNWASS